MLSIGETVMEVNDSGFSGTVETLRIQLLVDDSMLQVCVLSACPCALPAHCCLAGTGVATATYGCRCTPKVCGTSAPTGE